MQTSYADQLRQVRDSLTNENWIKGFYYSIKNNKTCFCVHGAGQALVNPEVKKALGTNLSSASAIIAVSNAADHRATSASWSGYEAARVINNAKKDLLSAWKNRLDWVKKNYTFQDKNYGNTSLHFLMGMFGITASFNDDLNTTLEMLKDKLSEAAKWAEENEELLQNN